MPGRTALAALPVALMGAGVAAQSAAFAGAVSCGA